MHTTGSTNTGSRDRGVGSWSRRTLSALLLALWIAGSAAAQGVEQRWLDLFDGPVAGVNEGVGVGITSGGSIVSGLTSAGSGTGLDFLVIVYQPDGLYEDIYRFNEPGAVGDDQAEDMALDGGDNIVMTGYSVGDRIHRNITTVKWAPDGTLLWAASYDGPGNFEDDAAAALALDDLGNVHVVGTVIVGDAPYAVTLKYGPDGGLLWSRVAAVSSTGEAITLDGGGNALVITSEDTILYDPDGLVLWSNGVGMHAPVGLGILPGGGYYLAATGGIQWYDAAGVLETTSTLPLYYGSCSSGNLLGRSARINGACADADGTVFAAGYAEERCCTAWYCSPISHICYCTASSTATDPRVALFGPDGTRLWADEDRSWIGKATLIGPEDEYIVVGKTPIVWTHPLKFYIWAYDAAGNMLWSANSPESYDFALARVTGAALSPAGIAVQGDQGPGETEAVTAWFQACGGCIIDQACYVHGEHDPDNDCAVCDVDVSRYAWTFLPDGAACEDGVTCNGADQCSAHACQAHAWDVCAPGETCFEALDTCHAFAGPARWVAVYDDPSTTSDTVRAVDADGTGGLYVTGSARTLRYSAEGDRLWDLWLQGNHVATDSTGNAVVALDTEIRKLAPDATTVWSVDPGASKFHPPALDLSPVDDAVIGFSYPDISAYKFRARPYRSDGSLRWTATESFGYTCDDWVADVAGNAAGYVCIAGLANEDCTAEAGGAVLYNATGGQVWKDTFIRGVTTLPRFVEIDDSNRCYVAAEVDDGTTAGQDVVVIVYDAAGQEAWSRQWGLSDRDDHLKAMALDPQDRLVVVGEMYAGGNDASNIVTRMYDPNGTELWNASFNSGAEYTDHATGVVLDPNGFIHVAGYAYMGGGATALTVSYDENGQQVAVRLLDGPIAGDELYAHDISADDQSNVFLGGKIVYTVGGETRQNYLVAKFPPPGCQIDAVTYAHGETHPANICQICDITRSVSAWSDNDGAACDDGAFCNGADTCQSGWCLHAGDPCPDDGLFCNGAESCDEAADQCLHAGDPCPDGNDCTDDTCNEGSDTCDHACRAANTGDPCCDDPVCAGEPVCEEVQCADGDEDGYGSPSSEACAHHPEEDCNDENPDVNPGAAENCSNEIDDDCDGLTDVADPDCAAPPWSAASKIQGERYGQHQRPASVAINSVSGFLLPLFGFVLWRRRKTSRQEAPAHAPADPSEVPSQVAP